MQAATGCGFKCCTPYPPPLKPRRVQHSFKAYVEISHDRLLKKTQKNILGALIIFWLSNLNKREKKATMSKKRQQILHRLIATTIIAYLMLAVAPAVFLLLCSLLSFWSSPGLLLATRNILCDVPALQGHHYLTLPTLNLQALFYALLCSAGVL